jgi:hypothetical protein
VPTIDLIDETYLVAAPAEVAAAVHEPARTAAWWPDLELTVFQDRGVDGVRWTATGALVGTAEIWLQPFADGTLLHVFLRCDATRRGSATEPATLSGRRALRVARARAWEIKQWSWALKRELEGDRAAGEPRPGVPVEDVTASPQAPVAPRPEGAVDAPGQPS